MSKHLSIIFLSLIILFCPTGSNLSDLAEYYTGTFQIYTYQYAELSNASIIKNGKSNIITCTTKDAKNILSHLDKNKITGMSFQFEGSKKDLSELINKTKLCVKFSEKIENITFCYGFSPIFKDYTMYNNEKINMQIALKDNVINVGVPLILGSI